MPTAIELTLDDDTCKRIVAARELLLRSNIRGLELDYPFVPHITIGYFKDGAQTAVESAVHEIAGQLSNIRLNLSHVGLFLSGNTAILFLGITPNEGIQNANRIVHEKLLEITPAEGGYFLPGALVPHVALGGPLPLEEVSRALSLLEPELGRGFPIHAISEGLIIDIDGREMARYPLSSVVVGVVGDLSLERVAGIPASH